MLFFACIVPYLLKTRSTGLSGNLASPTGEFLHTGAQPENSKSTSILEDAPDSQIKDTVATSVNIEPSIDSKSEDVSKLGGSIVGLRASKFSTSTYKNSGNVNNVKLPEIKPRSANLPSANITTANASKQSQIVTSGEETSANTAIGIGARPKPLPKPRPWSIVGVDRKSGELTSVSGGASTSAQCGKQTTETLKSKSEHNTTTKGTENEKTSCSTKFEQQRDPTCRKSSGPTAAAPSSRGSSVRDMINNMNKGQPESNSTPNSERKGSSLPRGVQPVSISSGSSSSTSGAAFAATSDSTKKMSSEGPKNRTNSPGINKKLSLSDKGSVEKRQSTCKDDPRILKLDDDFDVLEV